MAHMRALLKGLFRWRNVLIGLGVVLGGALLALAATWRPAIAPITVPARSSFARAEVDHGAILARLGDCAVCHTADGGRQLAGGRALPTPFGILFSDNLTPDPVTGIGNWSKEAFRRAMKDGVARDGSHLYPALPYEHFTHITDADLDALYAFLMTRDPVVAPKPANKLVPPLGFRPLLASWKLLFLHKGPVRADPGRSAQWNHGAYLAESLGHCGGCHSPRNLAGAEERGGAAYSGGVAEGWHAPALDARNPAARKWNAEAIYTYLRTGMSPDHSAAAGPMGPVVESLSLVPEGDVRAIAAYIGSKMGSAAPAGPALLDMPDRAARAFPGGEALFGGGCAGCHGPGAPMMGQGRPSLSLASDLRDDDPTNAVQAVLLGIQPPIGDRGPEMPGFAASLADAQVAQVLGYARARYTDRPPWPHLEKAVRAARMEGGE